MRTSTDTDSGAARVREMGPGTYAGFTHRYGAGVSASPYDTLNLGLGVGDDPEAVAANRAAAAGQFGISAEAVAWMSQVHGAGVAVVDRAGGAGRVDAMVTRRAGLALAVLVADCLPVLVADCDAGVIGAAHSGRPGTAQGIASALVAAMVDQGASAPNCVAVLGPAICGGCYEVPPHLAQEVTNSTPEGGCRTLKGTTGVDIRAAVTAQLRRAGVGTVLHDERCTQEEPELYSYRRDGRTGRFAGYIWRG